jgi:hypothetical protein
MPLVFAANFEMCIKNSRLCVQACFPYVPGTLVVNMVKIINYIIQRSRASACIRAIKAKICPCPHESDMSLKIQTAFHIVNSSHHIRLIVIHQLVHQQ